MSRLVVLTRQTLVPGFHLAGVEAVGVRDNHHLENLLLPWINGDEVMLVAIDHDLFRGLERSVKKALDKSEQLYIIPIPGSQSLSRDVFRHKFIEELTRSTIGIQISFKGEQDE